MHRSWLYLSVTLLGFITMNAQAGSMYCGSTLVSDGLQNPMSMTEVLAACGQPKERRKMSNELVYDDNKNIVIMRFDTNGLLKTVSRSGAAGQSAQQEAIEKIDQSIKETGTIPEKTAGSRDTNPSSVTKGRDADPRTTSKGKDASPGTITEGQDATPATKEPVTQSTESGN